MLLLFLFLLPISLRKEIRSASLKKTLEILKQTLLLLWHTQAISFRYFSCAPLVGEKTCTYSSSLIWRRWRASNRRPVLPRSLPFALLRLTILAAIVVIVIPTFPFYFQLKPLTSSLDQVHDPARWAVATLEVKITAAHNTISIRRSIFSCEKHNMRLRSPYVQCNVRCTFRSLLKGTQLFGGAPPPSRSVGSLPVDTVNAFRLRFQYSLPRTGLILVPLRFNSSSPPFSWPFYRTPLYLASCVSSSSAFGRFDLKELCTFHHRLDGERVKAQGVH